MFNSQLIQLFQLLPADPYLKVNEDTVAILSSNNLPLFELTPSKLTIPGISLNENFYSKPTNLKDSFVALDEVAELFSCIKSEQAFDCLNHMGFCYSVENSLKEKERLLQEAKAANLHLYEEASNDGTPWLFLGNLEKWNSPLVEFLPVQSTTDKWVDYWLPHFQIDIQTKLLGEEVEELLLKVFKGAVKPYRLFATKDFVFVVRARLGSINGINVYLDIGADGRMLRYHRRKLLQKI